MTFTLPPQKLCIKRKKDEEPVDSIYIQTDHQQKRRRFTDFVFRRHVVSEDFNATKSAIPAPTKAHKNSQDEHHVRRIQHRGRHVPLVRATKPGDEFNDQRRSSEDDGNNARGPKVSSHVFNGASPSVKPLPPPTTAHSGPQTLPSNNSNIPLPTPKSLPAKIPSISNLRHFHLTSPSLERPLQTQLGGRVQKRKKGGNTGVPILVEKSENKASKGEDRRGQSVKTESGLGRNHEESLLPPASPAARKRPGISARTSAPPSAYEDHTRSELNSAVDDDLTKELYDWAKQEHALQDAEREVRNADTHSSARSKSGGLNNARGEDSILASGGKRSEDSEMEDSGDYVYDTYFRHPYLPQVVEDEFMTDGVIGEGLPVIEKKKENAGIVIIDPHNQDEWEAYLEDGLDESDGENQDWEEEDENAENWHGNDYPDDPYSSDEKHTADDIDDTDDDDEHDHDFVTSDDEDNRDLVWLNT
ncbi:MAG: hypothetical protein M1837_002335 [Sclerophora amabilis]|nr:MAG: hypothetical protein M1837_002335 [Sclerophora amabilis]